LKLEKDKLNTILEGMKLKYRQVFRTFCMHVEQDLRSSRQAGTVE
jgi:hypothetical protein